ncbi:MAG: Asparagine synthetase (glutamine-hydrolyzing) 2 [Syntrophus sp. PtaB.Bin138]|nr:MAG: Asparagine synthetase (glutamine-hydrolyzing) 2 [Syntrophus sp. PtaB.Bin138]
MPGIIGIINKSQRAKNEHDLRLMIDSMMHEPFYNSGIYIQHEQGLYFGWTCHRNSYSDCMPVCNESKDIHLIFSGEVFADQDLLDCLKRKGHVFDPSTASALIHLYEEEGEDFLVMLNGWFNGVLIDSRTAKAILFNDRYGMQRIYYHENKDEFLFSSEAKALLRIRPGLRNLDNRGLGEYISCGCVLENRTLFSNIYLLPGGAKWTFQDGRCTNKSSYFYPGSWEDQPILDKETYYSRLKHTFQNILPRYFNSKEAVGMSLTGGLDTRMIMACINRPSGRLPCYTFGGMYRDSYDVKISRKVAEVCNQPHYTLTLGKEFLNKFPELAEKSVYISDGYLDAASAYELYLNKLAREIAPIRITGNGGSEILRSVRAFKATAPCNGLLNPDFDDYIRKAADTFNAVSKLHRLSFFIFRQAPWHGYIRHSVEQAQLISRTPYMDNDIVALVYQAPEETTTTNEIPLRLVADCNHALANILTDRGVGGISNASSTLFSIYREFFFKAEYYYNHGMPQWLTILDSMLAPLQLEKLFLGRNKFHHYRIWFRRELAQYVLDILSDQRAVTRSYLNNGFLEKMLMEHMRGDHNYTNEINVILTLELLHRLLIDG